MSVGRNWCEDCQRTTAGVCMRHLNVTVGPAPHEHRYVPFPVVAGPQRIYCESCGDTINIEAADPSTAHRWVRRDSA